MTRSRAQLSAAAKTELLRLFIERVDILTNSSYIRAVQATPLRLTIKGAPPSNTISIINTPVNLEHLYAFLFSLRLFIQDGDSISINRIAGLVRALDVSRPPKESLLSHKRNLATLLSSPSNIQINDKPITNNEILNTLLYGYHAHLKTYQPLFLRYKEWTSNPFAATIIGFAFNNVLIEYYRALRMMADECKIILGELILAEEPNSAEGWNTRGITLGRLGRTQEALSAFNKSIELGPDSAKAWVNKGVAQERLGHHQEALSAFVKACEMAPDYVEAWANRGSLLDGLGHSLEALIAFEKAIELGPNNHAAWCNKGVTLAKLGFYHEALHSFDKAVKLDPNDADTWFYIARIKSLLGDKPDSLESLQKAVTLNNSNRKRARDDRAFTWLWNDEDFRRATEG